MRVLIIGAGPAGLALAASLLQRRIEPVVVERAPTSRMEGYAVGLHVNGWNAAERLGLLEAFKERAVPLAEAEYRNPAGRRLFSYNYRALAAATGGKMLAIMRDAVQEVLLEAVRNRCEIRYATTVDVMHEDADGMVVVFSSGIAERFDIVVGADGFRSATREAWFGPHERFLRPLGYHAAAWRMPLARELDSSFIGMMDVDLQGGLYKVGDGTAATLFCWRDAATDRLSPDKRKSLLDSKFGDWAEPVSTALGAEIDWQRGFFDTIAQVEMPCWSKARVVLLGDAAWCLTFLSGQGTSMAMAGAWILASELASRPYAAAFAAYEARLRPITSRMQATSRRIGGHYVPESRLGMKLQSWLLPLFLTRPFAGMLARRLLATELELDPA